MNPCRILFSRYNKTELEMNALEDRLVKPTALAQTDRPADPIAEHPQS